MKNKVERGLLWCPLCNDYFQVGKHIHDEHKKAAQQKVWLRVFGVILLIILVINIVFWVSLNQ